MATQYSSFPTHSQGKPFPSTPLRASTAQDKPLRGRAHRLFHEWEQLAAFVEQRSDIAMQVVDATPEGIPTAYSIDYFIKCICGVNVDGSPVFAHEFRMEIKLPERYPQVDAMPCFRFVGGTLPWHPNIGYHGELAGRVCVNMPDTHASLAWAVERIALYLRYELYHAMPEPPYPEDLKVAYWVRTQGEPNNWIYYDQD